MLTPEQKATIRAEEIYREEVRKELASTNGNGSIPKKFWKFLNSSLGIWFLSSVVLAAISWKISNIALNRAQGETLTRLKWEVYNNGQEFEGVVSQAWNKDTYYAAFNTKLQNPRPRLFDYTTLDRFTFEIGYLGTSSDKAAASAARQAALDVWHLIEAEFKKEEWQTGIDATRKTKLDNAINKIVTEKIIEPFR